MIWNENDANPMHRRIPAEIVSRRVRPEPKVEQKANEDEVVVDLKTAVGLKPDARPKWLGKAIAMVESGKVSATDLFDIVTNRKFASGLPDRVLRKISAIVLDCQNVFSENQRRYLLSSECVLTREPVAAPVPKVEAEPEAPPKDKKDEDLAAALADRALEQALKGAPARPAPPPAEPPAREGAAAARAAQWEAAQDEAAARRQAKLAREAAVRAPGREEERVREAVFEDLVLGDPRAKVQEQRRKLEEDVDALFSRALGQQPTAEQDGGRGTAGREGKRKRHRDRDRVSRSISSRAARRAAKLEREKKASGRGDWRRGGDVATGSRAIFMHRDFQEDLPHMPRPHQPGITGRQRPGRSRSRS